jgi:hypothetical protein
VLTSKISLLGTLWNLEKKYSLVAVFCVKQLLESVKLIHGLLVGLAGVDTSVGD